MTSRRVDALLDAAEAEFAEKGFEAGSLRSIMRSADSDPGAIHYHFGSREALADALLERILTPLNRRRLELLEQAIDRADPAAGPSVPQLVEALIRPDLETARRLDSRSPGRARLIAAIYLRPAEFVAARVAADFAPVARAFGPHLAAAVPGVEPATIDWRVRWCVFGTLGALLADDSALFERSIDDVLADLTSTLAGALAA